jgi:hypothetical protein
MKLTGWVATFTLCTLTTLGSAALAPGSVHADVTLAPVVSALPAVYVASVKYPAGAYANGPLPMAIVLHNRSHATVTQVRVEQSRSVKNGAAVAQVQTVVDVPADGSVAVRLIDPDGFDPTGADKTYAILLGGAGGIDTTPRSVEAHPTCAYSATVDDPFRLAKADLRRDVEGHYVYVDDLKVMGPLTHGAAFTVRGTLTNHSLKPTSTTANLYADSMKTTSLGAIGPFAVPVRQAWTITLTTRADWTLGSHPFRLQDTNNEKVYNQGLAVVVARSCQVAMSLK